MNRPMVALAVACLLTLTLPARAALSVPPFDQAAYARPQHRVDVGGRHLNLYCTGSGSPAVILESGLGGTTLDWRYVQPPLSKSTRVCSYDRAGLGFSDEGPLPRTAGAIVDDLHALLQSAGIAPPYVLVGHSYGSYPVRLFADRYFSEVAGMVLIDPSHEDQAAIFAGIDPSIAADEKNQLEVYRLCATAARRGKLHPGTPAFAVCIGDPNRTYGKPLKAAQVRIAMRPGLWDTVTSELANFSSVSAGQVRAAKRSYDTLPLLVLTAGTSVMPDAKNARKSAVGRAWNKMHDQLAALSKSGTNRTVADAKHYIQLQLPAVVIAAIAQVVKAAHASPAP